jgi:hypothetical protein
VKWKRYWNDLLDHILKRPRLGTPENPEILEPFDPHSAPPRPSRLPIILSLVRTMLTLSVPAGLFLWMSIWLFHAGSSGNPLAWLLLILTAPVTLVATLLAAAVDFMLLLVLIATLLGRPV